MTWTAPKIWEGGDVWILGGGPSIVQQFGVPDDIIKRVQKGELSESAYSPYLKPLHDKHVIGINIAYRIGEWIDIVFFGDSKFFLKYKNELGSWQGLKVSCAPSARDWKWVKSLQRDRKSQRGITTNPKAVSWNGNSGAAAISLAVNMGVKRIFLLGFDMKLGPNDDQHWHGVYKRDKKANPPRNKKRTGGKLPFYRHLRGFPIIAKDAKKLGIEIYNVSPDSMIECFPKVSLKEALEISSVKSVLPNVAISNVSGKYDILSLFHEILNPRLYLEVGVRDGDSLQLARCPSIGVDINPCKKSIQNAEFYEMTSDEFFEKDLLQNRIPDFVFIDGLHNFEQVIKDFINVEKNSTRDTVVLFDDVLPFKDNQTVRTKPDNSEPWAGDVWKLVPIIKKHRSDLEVKLIDKGVLKVICFKWKHIAGIRLPSLNVVGEYTAEHVNRLYHSVERNLTIPHEFICVTDDPKGIECKTIPIWNDHRELGGCFTRLKMFSPEMKDLIGNRFIALDLDTVIVGNLDKMFSRKGDFIINKYTVRNYPHKHRNGQFYNGSIIMMDAGARSHVWKLFDPKTGPLLIQKNKGLIGTDQAWISLVLGSGEKMFTEKDGVYRFQLLRDKKHLPEDAKLILFAGNEDPSKRQDINWVKENWV